MNATKNYKLNQWSAEDLVLRTDFNADNTKLEAALTGLDASISTLNSSVSTINTNLSKKASTSSLNSAVSRISSLESGKVDKTAHNSDVSALRSENCWVKLGEKYTTAAGQTARVSIANISAYRELEIVFHGSCVSSNTGSLFLACNDTNGPVYSGEGNFSRSGSLSLVSGISGGSGGTVRLFPVLPSGQVALSCSSVARYKTAVSENFWHGNQIIAVFDEVMWSSLTSLTIDSLSAGGGLTAGSGMTVYGLKK